MPPFLPPSAGRRGIRTSQKIGNSGQSCPPQRVAVALPPSVSRTSAVLVCQADMNAELIAVQVGDALKYVTSVKEIDRIGAAVLRVRRDTLGGNATATRCGGQDW